ncbi:MAG: hypothetical protein JWR33_1748 [Naasia sp.]|jgi:hypothetical protein|uniref:hypothetical protein n=1 Tax=Naasia sp. TaxID=2546198 RepID=UPI00262F21EC|nr:hypothetical protein [Naasia sp.]MCU1571007.1 hypothetical protein [Naasia sp.]
MSAGSVATRTASAVRRFIRRLLVEPVRDGRLRDTGWPAGLRTIVVCATVAFALAVALVVGAPLLRATMPLSLSNGASTFSLPRAILPLFFTLVVLSAALLQTAALHFRLLAAVPVLGLSALLLLFLGGMDTGDGTELELATPGKIASVAAVLGLIALFVVRRRRPFGWAEFPIVLALIGGTTVIALARIAAHSLPFGIDFAPPTANLLMGALGSLAAPAALAAGVAVAEFAIAAAFALVAPLRARAAASGTGGAARARPVLLIAFVALSAWLVVETASRYLTGNSGTASLPELIGTTVLVALLAAGVGLLRLARGRQSVPPEEALATVGGVALPVAAAVTALLIPVTVLLLAGQVLTTWGAGTTPAALASAAVSVLAGSTMTLAVRAVIAVLLTGLAFVLARRGRRGSPELLLAFGLVIAATSVPALLGWNGAWSSDAASVLLAAGSIALGVVLAIRRRLGSRELAALCVALLLAEAAAWREVLANPLSALLGASVVAFVLLGFLWGFLAGADTTHRGSPAFPIPSRVLLFLANALFGVTVLAFAALARDFEAVIDLDQFAGAGDAVLGSGLIAVTGVLLWGGVLESRAAENATAGGPA